MEGGDGAWGGTHAIQQDSRYQDVRGDSTTGFERCAAGISPSRSGEITGHSLWCPQNLAKSGITEEELTKRIEKNLLVEMIVEKEIFGKATVDLGEAKKIYEKEKGSYKDPSGPLSFEEARPLIEMELKTAAVHKREDEWVAALKKRARIEIAP